MLTKIDKNRASVFRSATMKASYMSILRGCATGGEGSGTHHGRAERGGMDHAQALGSTPRGSRQARASDLRTEARQDTARGY